jgi:hypothetical protein
VDYGADDPDVGLIGDPNPAVRLDEPAMVGELEAAPYDQLAIDLAQAELAGFGWDVADADPGPARDLAAIACDFVGCVFGDCAFHKSPSC